MMKARNKKVIILGKCRWSGKCNSRECIPYLSLAINRSPHFPYWATCDAIMIDSIIRRGHDREDSHPFDHHLPAPYRQTDTHRCSYLDAHVHHQQTDICVIPCYAGKKKNHRGILLVVWDIVEELFLVLLLILQFMLEFLGLNNKLCHMQVNKSSIEILPLYLIFRSTRPYLIATYNKGQMYKYHKEQWTNKLYDNFITHFFFCFLINE